MRYAHAIGAAYKAPEYEEAQQEHTDAVAEEGRRDRKPMRRGVLQYHGGRRVGVRIGSGDIQVSGVATRMVGQ